jgi:hypothetical protein
MSKVDVFAPEHAKSWLKPRYEPEEKPYGDTNYCFGCKNTSERSNAACPHCEGGHPYGHVLVRQRVAV